MKNLIILGTLSAALAATPVAATIDRIAQFEQRAAEQRLTLELQERAAALQQRATWEPIANTAAGVAIIGGALGVAIAAIGGGVGLSRYASAQAVRAVYLAYPDKRGFLPIVLETVPTVPTADQSGRSGQHGQAERATRAEVAEQAASALDDGAGELTWEQLAPRFALNAYSSAGGNLARSHWVGQSIDNYEITRAGYDAMLSHCQRLGLVNKRGGAWVFARHVGRAALHQAMAVAE